MYYAYLHMLHFHHKWPNLKMYANCFKTKMTIKTAYTKIFFLHNSHHLCRFFLLPFEEKSTDVYFSQKHDYRYEHAKKNNFEIIGKLTLKDGFLITDCGVCILCLKNMYHSFRYKSLNLGNFFVDII